ncbi:vWA domain-containing protein [Tundrisphaera lichenicola]|uniref:vWA domain-containing protein n=1 Tax=Tundrisphaera lichenicola TaxID=2029860 RepID=UPI003EBF95A0
MASRPAARASCAFGLAAWIVGSIAIAAQAEAQESPPKEPPAKAPAKAKPASSKAKPPIDDEPVVMSAEAAARARGRSSEGDRYGAEPDWREIPAWRQASFFGIRAEGRVFVFVVDRSGSMIDADRLDRAKAELRRSVGSLQSPQRFKVIFYNDRPLPMPGDFTKPADYPSKAQLARWMNFVEPEGETDPRSALALALAMRPDAVFLLSDGAFPPGTADSVVKFNPKKVPIHCVDLAGGAGGDDLRKIAQDSGGQYAGR